MPLSMAVAKFKTTVDPEIETLEGVTVTPPETTVKAETGAVVWLKDSSYINVKVKPDAATTGAGVVKAGTFVSTIELFAVTTVEATLAAKSFPAKS